jgi:hypothetical protein
LIGNEADVRRLVDYAWYSKLMMRRTRRGGVLIAIDERTSTEQATFGLDLSSFGRAGHYGL